ncbi:MAG TPA: sigma-70 family RNA polymerase sigma factor [Longimicrobiaceae bacterium]|nr:sigma-70 family RNA polymerase sigma factor [Longimicrobiaceae bacterium]
MEPSDLLVAHRQWIEKVAAITCHRNSVWGDEAEEFASLVMMKVIENDYAVLRKFRGESDLKTYLATVVTRRFQEYLRERWGRWRHSAQAERLGQPAKDLEALVYRDRYTLHEAVEVLRTSGRTSASDGELTRLFAELPVRSQRPGTADPTLLDRLPDPARTDDRVIGAEAEERCRKVMEALLRTLSRMDPDDQILVRGRFGEGRSVADIARGLRRDQAPLYRRSERLRDEIRRSMEAGGIRGEDVDECLDLSDG